MKLACEFVERYVIEKFGPDQACQIIMLTDGRPPPQSRIIIQYIYIYIL
jgi:hypothetical protein